MLEWKAWSFNLPPPSWNRRPTGVPRDADLFGGGLPGGWTTTTMYRSWSGNFPLDREQRRLAAIVSADIAGYSRLMGRDESGTLAALKGLRREIVDPAIAGHNGRIVKTTGDGLLLEFPSVVDAVRCMIQVQTETAAKVADMPEDRRITFRVGVNIGDIIIDGDDIFGDGVNVAARLQEIAAPGGMCVSSRVHDDVRDRLEAIFEDGGSQTLKNIARPVQVWHWASGSGSALEPVRPALAVPDRPSIAVLPFQNMSGDPEQEYSHRSPTRARPSTSSRSGANSAYAMCWKAACAKPVDGSVSPASS